MPTAKKTTMKKAAEKKPATKKAATKKPAAKKAAAKTPTAKKAAAKAPATSGKTIAGYIATLDGWRAAVVQQLCALIAEAAPDSTGSIKWAQPVFEDHGPFCYVRAFTGHVNLGFWRGMDLPDAKGRLHGGGDRMAHIKITGPEAVDVAAFTKLVKAAVQLNRSHGDPTKRG
jgi:hypothetical protein